MRDVVYVCRPGDNEELRWSLRSLQNIPHRSVYIFGDAPEWYVGPLVRLPAKKNKFDSAWDNAFAAMTDNSLTREVIYMNDDFFITSPIEEPPHYHRGPLAQKTELWASRTCNLIRRWDLTRNPFDYSPHMPQVIDRLVMADVMRRLRAERPSDYMYYRRHDIYAAIKGLKGERRRDCKIFGKDLLASSAEELVERHKPFLSTNDSSFWGVLHLMKLMFPDPSPYERGA